MTTNYTLFDIPSKSSPPESWSPNTWKARGVLNYKGVPYETEWVEYPDIRVRLAEMGLPSKSGSTPYTLPMLRVTITPADGSEKQVKYLTDSADIAKYINDEHPEPPIDMDGPINLEILKFMPENLGDAFSGLVLCDVPDRLSERSAAYFHETRKIWMEMPIPDFQQKKINEGAWTKMENGMTALRKLLNRNGGPFLLGNKVSFGDMRIIGYIKWAEQGSSKETYQKIREYGGKEVDRLMEAASEITARSTY